MSELEELARRCEAVTGPDRELDAEIWLACVPGTTRRKTRYVHKATETERVIDETRENHKLVIVPAYTASLDAAMTLVPEGWSRAFDDLDDGTCGWRLEREEPEQEVYSKAASPALALCAAALRARGKE